MKGFTLGVIVGTLAGFALGIGFVDWLLTMGGQAHRAVAHSHPFRIPARR